MINHRTWYENFLLSHKNEEERSVRFEDKDCKQTWNYSDILEVLSEVDFIPEEEAEKFYISREGE